MTTARWVLGVDSGGSGLRVALAAAGPPDGAAADGPAADGATGPAPGRGPALPEPVGRVLTAEPVPTGAAGIDPHALLDRLLTAARTLLAEAAPVGGAPPVEGAGEPFTAVCVGAAGMATLGAGLRAELPGALRRALGVRRLALAADAVTGYAGALGDRPGAVVAAGTGLIALGTELAGWHRADGWGHLLGDCGGGAWIGRVGLAAALRAHDSRPGGSAALLAAAEQRFGPVATLPGQLYPRADRPAVLASFAPAVADCAAAGDPVAAGLLAEAAREIAGTAQAAWPAVPGAELALTGGLLGLGAPLLGPLHDALDRLLPGVAARESEGSPLGGALLIARQIAHGRLRLPADGALLSLHGAFDQPHAGA